MSTTPRRTISVSGRTHLQLSLLAAVTQSSMADLVAAAVTTIYADALAGITARAADLVEPSTPAAEAAAG